MPVEELLRQFLLLPLFADLGMLVISLRSARGRAGGALAALLSVLSLVVVAQLGSEWLGWRQAAPVVVALVGPTLLWLLLAYSGGRRLAGSARWLPAVLPVPAMVFLLAAVALDWPPTNAAYMVIATAYFLPASAVLVACHHGGTLIGKEPDIIGLAMTFLFVSGPVYYFAYSGIVPPTIFPYTSAISAGLLTYLVVRYKSFCFRPSSEESRQGESGLSAGPGLYLARADGSVKARTMFSDAMRHGVPGLVVTRQHPVAFRRLSGLKTVPLIWMANSAYEKSLPPSEPDILLHALKDYMTQSGRSVVLLEDLDYLITNAGLYPIFDMLQALMSEATRSGAVILLSSELLTPDERHELAELGLKPLR